MSTLLPESPIVDWGAKPVLHIKVLGRMLEHLGVQMYKRREAALAELVANGWDAGATTVRIDLPSTGTYNQETDVIVISDNGSGMDLEEVQNDYLVVGRNRRASGGAEVEFPNEPLPEARDLGTKSSIDSSPSGRKRRVMGRKGIGKLAGFGLAKQMTVETWKKGFGVRFTLDISNLKQDDNVAKDVPIYWESIKPLEPWGSSGTRIVLSGLKHRTPLEPEPLELSLARRFTRSIRGEMVIKVGDDALPDPTPPLDYRYPNEGTLEHTLDNGKVVRFWYGFAHDVIKVRELRGFSVLVNGKVAQAPPFFFDVEATASGQHSTKYVIGEIEADFIDTGVDDDSDVIATDRQEIDWEAQAVIHLKTWGERLSRKVLAECRDFRGKRTVKEVYDDPDLSRRINKLDQTSQLQIRRFLIDLSLREGDDSTLKLADALVRAYEFRQFHDVIEEIEKAADDPNQLAAFLTRLKDWKTLESRAVLEIIEGRLDIIDRFEALIVNDAAETAHRRGDTNMHDAVAGFPWLLDPDWQVLAEEKTVTKQLVEWGAVDIPEDEKERYDFLALSDGSQDVVVEIKRSGHPVTFDETSRLLKYKERLSKSRPNIVAVLIYGGTLDLSAGEITSWEQAEDRQLRKWSEIFRHSREMYERYRAVLKADIDHPNFAMAQRELVQTRSVVSKGTFYRNQEARKSGLGVQDADYTTDKST